MLTLIASLFGAIGSGVSGFFGFKQEQGKVVEEALGTLGQVMDADANYTQAASEAIAAVYQNGPPIERLWRPVNAILCVTVVYLSAFGLLHLTPEVFNTFSTWAEMSIIGYMPLRSIEKIAKTMQVSSILKTFIQKKLG